MTSDYFVAHKLLYSWHWTYKELLRLCTAKPPLFGKSVEREGSAICVLKYSAVQHNSNVGLFKGKTISSDQYPRATGVNIVGSCEGHSQHHNTRKHS